MCRVDFFIYTITQYTGIECDGAQATLNDAQTIGLSVTTVVLVVGMLLLVVLVFGLVMVILRVKKAKHSGETILKGKDDVTANTQIHNYYVVVWNQEGQ